MKKNKVLKIFILVLIIILCLFIIHIIRNYIILNKIIKKQNEFKDSKNYYFISEHYNNKTEDGKMIVKHYYKDNKHKIVYNDEKTKIVTTTWYDENTHRYITKVNDEDESITKSDFILGNELPTYRYDLSFIVMRCFISYENINGNECYKIFRPNNPIFYISKTDGMIMRTITSNNYIVDYKDYNLEQLKNEDVEK